MNFFENLFDLRRGASTDEIIINNVENNVTFSGANFWLLIFAIFIASIGLNINSTAIIIGAMLISPLMGPIVGVGLALGINDSSLFHRSVKNLVIATVIGIIVSTLYFLLSPINGAQSELLARTSPTIYDVLVALFGGFAGIVGSTRVEKGNVIPGVAIATALMPPLCTVGYGLATGQPYFFFGAAYLYAINCIFICLATLVGVKYLRVPAVAYLQPKQALRTRRILMSIVVGMLIPAFYLAYVFVEQNNFNNNVAQYIQNEFTSKGYAVIYKKVDYRSNPRLVELAFVSKTFDQEEINDFQNRLKAYSLDNTQLNIRQGTTSLTEKQWETAIANMRSDSEKIAAIQAQLSNKNMDDYSADQIFKEIKSINDKVTKISIGTITTIEREEATSSPILMHNEKNSTVILVYHASDSLFTEKEKEMLTNWLTSRLQNQEILVYFF